MVRITTKDMERGTFVEIDIGLVTQSITIMNLIEGIPDSEEPIPLINVNSVIFSKMCEFWEHHIGEPMDEDPLVEEEATKSKKKWKKDKFNHTSWDWDFINSLSEEENCAVTVGANFLDSPRLLDLGCESVARVIQGMTSEEIKAKYGLPPNAFCDIEEQRLECQRLWAESAAQNEEDLNEMIIEVSSK